MATRRQSNRSPRPLKPFGYHRPRRAQATCAKGTDYKDLMRMALRLSSSLSRRMGDPGPDRRTDRLRRHQLRRACPESSPSDDQAAAIATLAELAPGRLAVALGAGFTGRLTLGQKPYSGALLSSRFGSSERCWPAMKWKSTARRRGCSIRRASHHNDPSMCRCS